MKISFPHLAFVAALVLLQGCSTTPTSTASNTLRDQVFAAERAFARTMERRDLAAFGTFVSEEVIFFTGPTPLRGRSAVVDAWSRYFAAKEAPFSWEPDTVEVLDSGVLALSSGPVKDSAGKVIGRFSSIWRQEAPGVWHVVFDRGSSADDCGRQRRTVRKRASP
jgi:ketosteroid isomerase-like protein